jgi:hypothetical protein
MAIFKVLRRVAFFYIQPAETSESALDATNTLLTVKKYHATRSLTGCGYF